MKKTNGFLLVESFFSLILLSTFLTLFLSISIHMMNRLGEQKKATFLFQHIYDQSLLLPQQHFEYSSHHLIITSTKADKEWIICAAIPNKKVCTN